MAREGPKVGRRCVVRCGMVEVDEACSAVMPGGMVRNAPNHPADEPALEIEPAPPGVGTHNVDLTST